MGIPNGFCTGNNSARIPLSLSGDALGSLSHLTLCSKISEVLREHSSLSFASCSSSSSSLRKRKSSQIMKGVHRDKGLGITEVGRLVCGGRFEVGGLVVFARDRF